MLDPFSMGILMFEDSPCTERIERFLMALDP